MTTSPSAVRRASSPEHPNRLWIADLAPVSLFEEPLYIGVVLDCCTLRCLGWRFSNELELGLIGGAVEDAQIVRVQFGQAAPGRPIALAFAGRCALAHDSLQNGGVDARDRQVSRNFLSWLHADLLVSARWRLPTQAKAAIGKWIQGTYNPAVESPAVPVLEDSGVRGEAEGGAE